MIELSYTEGTAQTVESGNNVVFNTVIEKCGCAEYHRRGSGQIKLTKPGRYLVTFSGNLAAVTTATEVDLALTQDGDIIDHTTMLVTPAAVENYFNVSTQTYIDVPMCCGNTCCVDVAVENISTQSVLVINPNITAIRVNG